MGPRSRCERRDPRHERSRSRDEESNGERRPGTHTVERGKRARGSLGTRWRGSRKTGRGVEVESEQDQATAGQHDQQRGAEGQGRPTLAARPLPQRHLSYPGGDRRYTFPCRGGVAIQGATPPTILSSLNIGILRHAMYMYKFHSTTENDYRCRSAHPREAPVRCAPTGRRRGDLLGGHHGHTHSYSYSYDANEIRSDAGGGRIRVAEERPVRRGPSEADAPRPAGRPRAAPDRAGNQIAAGGHPDTHEVRCFRCPNPQPHHLRRPRP